MLRQIELLTIQPGVQSVTSHQLGMPAVFHERAMIQDKNPISFADRGEPVGNKEGGAARHQALKRGHQESFHL